MKTILVMGSSGGVGQAVCKVLADSNVITVDRDEWDLRFPEKVDNLQLEKFDIIVSCVGYNVGANNGFFNNNTEYQNNQVVVNFTSQLLLMKEYLKNRKNGHLIYFTSDNIDDPISYNLFYTAAKQALRYSANVLSKEFPNFIFTEICPGKIKSNMLKQNYGNRISEAEIELMYEERPYLTCDYVARVVEMCIINGYRFVKFENGVALFDGNF